MLTFLSVAVFLGSPPLDSDVPIAEHFIFQMSFLGLVALQGFQTFFAIRRYLEFRKKSLYSKESLTKTYWQRTR